MKAANKCRFKFEFQSRFLGAYSSCKRHGWIEEALSHMLDIRKPNGYWNQKNSFAAAKRYNLRSTFAMKASKAYEFLCKTGLLEQACVHMDDSQKPNGYYSQNINLCNKLAKKCKTKSEFNYLFRGAYAVLSKRGLLSSACRHMNCK